MSTSLIVVDRIVNGIAVCEADGKTVDIPLSQIRGKIREGDVLRVSEDGAMYSADAEKTAQRSAVISARFDRIKAKNQKPPL
jgi:methyl coenzyme M reductase gamma subunit